jgi:hypothetical protein
MQTSRRHVYTLKLTTSKMSFTASQILPLFSKASLDPALNHSPVNVFMLAEWFCLSIQLHQIGLQGH